MSIVQIIIILSGLILTILIAWYFWFAPKAQTRVAVSTSGVQEVAITVKGGYTPDVIVVQKDRPVRLIFTRQESAACSEKVLFPDFNEKSADQILIDVVHCGAADFNRGDHAFETTFDERDIRGFDGNVRACTDGETNIRLHERGRVVDTIADHCNFPAFCL